MTIDEWRAIIAYAIGVVRENGWKIEFGINIDPQMGICCPLGALYLVNNDRPPWPISLCDVSDTIGGLTLDNANAFAMGFDDELKLGESSADLAWYQLGADFRRAILDEWVKK